MTQRVARLVLTTLLSGHAYAYFSSTSRGLVNPSSRAASMRYAAPARSLSTADAEQPPTAPAASLSTADADGEQPLTAPAAVARAQPPPPAVGYAVLKTLASNALALLSSSEEEAAELMSVSDDHPELIAQIFADYDKDATDILSEREARSFFSALARELLVAAAAGGAASAGREGREPRRRAAAAANAKRLLEEEAAMDGGGDGGSPGAESSAVVDMAGHLLALVDTDGDGRITLEEVARLFSDGLLGGADSLPEGLRPLEPLYELRGCLQLLPRIARHFDEAPEGRIDGWHQGIPVRRTTTPVYEAHTRTSNKSAPSSCLGRVR